MAPLLSLGDGDRSSLTTERVAANEFPRCFFSFPPRFWISQPSFLSLSVGPKPQKLSVLQMDLLASAGCLQPVQCGHRCRGAVSSQSIGLEKQKERERGGRALLLCGILVACLIKNGETSVSWRHPNHSSEQTSG